MPLTRYYTTDNAQSTLKAGISWSTTTLIIEDGEGARFPSSFPFWIVLEKHDWSQVLKRELALVTNRVGDVLTATRGAGACLPSSTSNTRGTTQYSFDVGDSITHILTPQQIEGISASVQDLETGKLNASWGLRTGLTPNRVIATNGAGEETEVWGASGQVLGFGAGGLPQAVSPTVDIAGLTSKTTPIGADQLIISDSEAGGVNKKISLKDAVIIADQTAQSAFTGDTDLFVVKQASGGLRKMTVADIRRAFINSSFNYTQAKISVWPSAGTANVFDYSASYATGSNGGGMITALFKHTTNGGSYVTGIVQISDDNSNWTTIWSEQWYENDSYPDYRTISLVFKAAYVRIWVARDFGYSWSVRIKWSATINLTK